MSNNSSFPSFQAESVKFSNFSMETEFSIIEDRETQENYDPQQCKTREVVDSHSLKLEVFGNINAANILEDDTSADNDVICITNDQEEPIDLTFDRGNVEDNFEIENVPITNPKRIIIQPKPPEATVVKSEQFFPTNGKGVKRTVDIIDPLPQETIVSNTPYNQPYLMTEIQHTPKPSNYTYTIVRTPQPDLSGQLTARQQEILKMAKSIFSKRTRTLYHWMYPTASKQQIKQVVSSTWESMAAQEKNIYIAQVLGRFGCNNANLMVNPQLGQIKELPPMPGIQEFNPKASELQNAISSISNETDSIEQCFSNEQPAKKRRVSKKKLTQALSNSSHEFDDDPELSQELAQFSIMLKNQF